MSFQELSSIIFKISCSVVERYENRSFFEYKRLFIKQRYMFLWSTCRVKRYVKNAIE